MSSKQTIIVSSNFSENVKNYLDENIKRIANLIRNKQLLRSIDKFVVILLVMRQEFSKHLTRYKAVELINSMLCKDLESYSESCVANEQRLQFARLLHESYQTEDKIKCSKKFEQAKFDAFLQVQKDYSLHNSYNVVDALCSVTKNNKKRLISFKVNKAFVAYIDALVDTDDYKVIAEYAVRQQ